MKGLGEDLREFLLEDYKKRGICELYPPQVEAISTGVLDGENLLAAIPTASGKTLIAELAALYSISRGGMVLYIVPLRALATEKYEEFSRLEGGGINVGISTGDFDKKAEYLGKYDIVIATSEKVDSLIRNDSEWLSRVSCLVVDEIHLLDSIRRGPTLEVILARLRNKNRGMQVVALSATVRNARQIADWLDAKYVVSNWRPVPLKEGVFFGGRIKFSTVEEDDKDKEREVVSPTIKEPVVALVLDTLEDGGQCLVFESTRKNAEAMAQKISKALVKALDVDEVSRDALTNLSQRIAATGDMKIVQRLSKFVRSGVAFHHAGLDAPQRTLVEKAFRERLLKCVVSTPTLAAGLNLPARRVIIRSLKRYDASLGSVYIPVLEYKQMAGRAGRPGLDMYGEALLVARSPEDEKYLMDTYICGEPEAIESKLGVESALRVHTLSLIAGEGLSLSSLDEILAFFSETFYGHSEGTWQLGFHLISVIDFLRNTGMIEGEKIFEATPLGKLTARLYIDPLSAYRMVTSLQMADEVRDVTLLHTLCSTPDMRTPYLRRSDFELVESFLAKEEDFLLFVPQPDTIDYDLFLRELKGTMILEDWISEVNEDVICERYGIGPGDLKAQVETARWLAHSLTEIAKLLESEYHMVSKSLEKRLEYGVSSELLNLTKVRGIGRVRARKLYSAGITSPADLLKVPQEELARLVGGHGIAASILSNLGVKVEELARESADAEIEKNEVYNAQKTVFDY